MDDRRAGDGAPGTSLDEAGARDERARVPPPAGRRGRRPSARRRRIARTRSGRCRARPPPHRPRALAEGGFGSSPQRGSAAARIAPEPRSTKLRPGNGRRKGEGDATGIRIWRNCSQRHPDRVRHRRDRDRDRRAERGSGRDRRAEHHGDAGCGGAHERRSSGRPGDQDRRSGQGVRRRDGASCARVDRGQALRGDGALPDRRRQGDERRGPSPRRIRRPGGRSRTGSGTSG